LLDGDRPANTCIPPFYPGKAPAQPHTILTPKNTFASIKKFANFSEIFLVKKKIRERV
jgi:hypothetical protein